MPISEASAQRSHWSHISILLGAIPDSHADDPEVITVGPRHDLMIGKNGTRPRQARFRNTDDDRYAGLPEELIF